ncbi:hypothetical protein CHUAL_012375 [Chamberlinius hualienensis]
MAASTTFCLVLTFLLYFTYVSGQRLPPSVVKKIDVHRSNRTACVENSDCLSLENSQCVGNFCICEPGFSWDIKVNQCIELADGIALTIALVAVFSILSFPIIFSVWLWKRERISARIKIISTSTETF